MARPRSVSDAQIEAAARAVFVEQGPGASVAAVAARLGVSHAALFARVGPKSRLMLRALCPGRPSALDALDAPPGADAAAHLERTLLDLMSFLRSVVPNLVVLKAAGLEIELPPGAPPPPVALRGALSAWLAAAAAAGHLGIDAPTAVAEGLLGAMEARCFNGYLGGEAFTPGEDAAFVRALVAGLAPRRGGHDD